MLVVQNVSKVYRLSRNPSDRLLESFRRSTGSPQSDFWALRDISFEAERGASLALIGPNGCGKSTLLQIVSGILQPTTGTVVRRGRVSALLELGAGFNPEFTGRENVLINGELLGLSRAAILSALPKIENFAGIGRFIDRPVKEYSSGMYVRLAFSTAIHVEPEILIVDEALAVGDAAFANRCVRKLNELRERRITVLFVSHDLGLVKQLADHAIFLSNGTIQVAGDPKTVIDRYIATVLEGSAIEQEALTHEPIPLHHRHGNGASSIQDVRLMSERGEDCAVIESGQAILIRVKAHCNRDVCNLMVGILIRTRIGMDVYGTNTTLEGSDLGALFGGDEILVEFRFKCWLTPQQYSVTVATQNHDGSSQDWIDDAIVFEVISKRQSAGVADLQAQIAWSKTTT